jgi:hypothetical protein
VRAGPYSSCRALVVTGQDDRSESTTNGPKSNQWTFTERLRVSYKKTGPLGKVLCWIAGISLVVGVLGGIPGVLYLLPQRGTRQEIDLAKLAHMITPDREIRGEIDLVELVRMFTSDADGQSVDWTTGATVGSPVEWTSPERYGDTPDDGFFARFPCARHGKTVVKIHGEPSHEQFEEYLRPAIWDVSLYGCMAGVECVQFSSYGSGYSREPNVVEPLAKYLTLERSHPYSGFSLIRNLYRMSIPGKKESWLVESWSKGNHVWNVELTLFSEEEAHSLASEWCLSLE